MAIRKRKGLRPWQAKCGCGRIRHKDARECSACAADTYDYNAARIARWTARLQKMQDQPRSDLREIARVHGVEL